MDNATRKELLYRARSAGYPGSILDVFANYDQGKDLIAEFQDQQRQQQMSGIAAQKSGLQQSAQGGQPQIEMQPQPVAMPAVPSFQTPAPKFTPPQPPQPIGIQSQDSPMGIVSGQSGPNQGRAIFATGGFKKDPPKEPIYVESEDDPRYKNYKELSELYTRSKKALDKYMPGHAYDANAALSYKNIKKDSNGYYVPDKYAPGGKFYLGTHDGKTLDIFKPGTEVNKIFNEAFTKNIKPIGFMTSDYSFPIYEEPGAEVIVEARPKAIDIKPLPTQPIDIKPTLTKLPLPQTNKQKVIVGDRVRIQDIKTKKFLGWEDEEELPMRRVVPPPGGFATGGFTEGDPPDWRSILNYKNAATKQNLVGDVRKVEKPTAVAESTKPVNTPKASTEWKDKSGKQIIEEAKAQEAYNALPEEMKRRDTLTADTRSDTEKFARQAWTAISYPMATISAVNRGHDIPMGSLGMYSPYEGYDVGGPMNFLVDLVAGTPGFIVNAASRQGEQLVDDPFEYGYTMSPLGMLDPKTRLKSLGNYLDLGAVIPAAGGAGKFLTTQTPLRYAHEYNPWAGKLGEYNRVVGSDAIADLQASGLVRSGKGAVRIMDGIPIARPTAFPSFAKGAPGEIYIKEVVKRGDTPYIISTDRPMAVSTLGRHGKGSTRFPVGEDGKYLTNFPASEATVYQSSPNWLTGYKKIKKETGGFTTDWENIKLLNRAKAMGHTSIEEYRASNWGYGKNHPTQAKDKFTEFQQKLENEVAKKPLPQTLTKMPIVGPMVNEAVKNSVISKQNDLTNYDWKNLSKKDQIDYGIQYLKYHNPDFTPEMEVPMRMTAWMENTYGDNPKAYNRKYTNSFMSLDSGAIGAIYNPLGSEGRYLTRQKNVIEILKKNGYNNREELEKALQEDDPKAAMLTASLYYNIRENEKKTTLKDSKNSKEVFNHHYNLYNGKGSSTYNTEEEEYARFLKGWDKYGPNYKPKFKKLGGPICYTCVGRKRRV